MGTNGAGPRGFCVAMAVVLVVATLSGCGGGASQPTGTTVSSSANVTPEGTISPTGVQTTSTPSAPEATAIPSATPFPTVTKPVTKVTKLGIGVYGLRAGPGNVDELVRAQPSVFLLENPDMGFCMDLRKAFPNAFIIGRLSFAQQPLDNPEQRGIALADKVAEWAVPRKGYVDAWVGYNEAVEHNDYAGYQALNKLEAAFARQLQDKYGVSAVVLNDAPGAIEPEDYPKYFSDAIRTAKYLGIHAYGKPEMNTLKTPDADYFVLRYRLIHNALEAAGIKNVKMVLTEVGIEHGWQRYHLSEENAAKELMWVADELDKDPYVVGMAIFGYFCNTTGSWWDYDIAGTKVIDFLGTYQPAKKR